MALRAAKQLIDAGVSVQRIRHSIGSLKRILPEVQKPLSELVLVATGDLVLVLHQGSTFEAVSGQEWIFEVSRLQREVERATGARSGGRARAPDADRSTRLRNGHRRTQARSPGGCGPGSRRHHERRHHHGSDRHAHHRHREPEGRLRQDHHRGESGGLSRRRTARACSWSTSTRRRTRRIALGIDPEALDENLYEVLAEEEGAARLADVIVPAGERLHLAPSGIVLSALEQKLAQERAEARTDRLARALAALPDPYDYVLIDCPPNVGLLTFNALRAAHEVIVPVEASHFALHGVQKLLETIALLAERLRIAPDVRILADALRRPHALRPGDARRDPHPLRRRVLRHGDPQQREAARGGAPRAARRAHGAVVERGRGLRRARHRGGRARARAGRGAGRDEAPPLDSRARS